MYASPSSVAEADGPRAFRNERPRARAERTSKLSKETLEKSRIRERKEKFVRYDPPADCLRHHDESPAYQSPADRFERDAAALERKRTNMRNQQKQESYERRRQERCQDTRERNQHREDRYKRQQDQLMRLPERPIARTNGSGDSYNIFTFQYFENEAGKALKAQDQAVVERARLRGENLHRREISVGHNIITCQTE